MGATKVSLFLVLAVLVIVLSVGGQAACTPTTTAEDTATLCSDGIDNDCDGSADISIWDAPHDSDCEGIDVDGDGVYFDEDCDETDLSMNKALREVCDDKDTDCSGIIDELGEFHSDSNAVGSACNTNENCGSFGNACLEGQACAGAGGPQPICAAEDGDGDGYNIPEDCDDANADIRPGVMEVCNGVNDNCDDYTDEVARLDNSIDEGGACTTADNCGSFEGSCGTSANNLEHFCTVDYSFLTHPACLAKCSAGYARNLGWSTAAGDTAANYCITDVDGDGYPASPRDTNKADCDDDTTDDAAQYAPGSSGNPNSFNLDPFNRGNVASYINPGAEENKIDSVDNNCNGQTDEGAFCGDGYVSASAGEQCDEGGVLGTFSDSVLCNGPNAGVAACKTSVCGDGYVNSALGFETCDDGNKISGDGCSAICKLEPPLCTRSPVCETTQRTICVEVGCGDSLADCAEGTTCETTCVVSTYKQFQVRTTDCYGGCADWRDVGSPIACAEGKICSDGTCITPPECTTVADCQAHSDVNAHATCTNNICSSSCNDNYEQCGNTCFKTRVSDSCMNGNWNCQEPGYELASGAVECTPSTCTPGWNCSEWSTCLPAGTQTRTCGNKCDAADKKQEQQTCTYNPNCEPNWRCSEWGGVCEGGKEVRLCTDSNECDDTSGKPPVQRDCASPAGGALCGNNKLDEKEACDKIDGAENFGTTTCADLVASSTGTLSCEACAIRPGNCKVIVSETSEDWVENQEIIKGVVNGLITEYQFKAKRAVGQPQLTITTFESKPEAVPAADNVYKYVQVEKSFADEDIESVTLKFGVEKSWLEAGKFDKTKVKLSRYEVDKWVAYGATVVEELTNKITYGVSLPGLSYFAVTSEKLPEEQQVGTESQQAASGGGEGSGGSSSGGSGGGTSEQPTTTQPYEFRRGSSGGRPSILQQAVTLAPTPAPASASVQASQAVEEYPSLANQSAPRFQLPQQAIFILLAVVAVLLAAASYRFYFKPKFGLSPIAEAHGAHEPSGIANAKSFIAHALAEGHGIFDVKNHLLKSGWDKNTVSQAIDESAGDLEELQNTAEQFGVDDSASATKQLRAYVKAGMAKGYTEAQIKAIVLANGWPEDVVDAVLG